MRAFTCRSTFLYALRTKKRKKKDSESLLYNRDWHRVQCEKSYAAIERPKEKWKELNKATERNGHKEIIKRNAEI